MLHQEFSLFHFQPFKLFIHLPFIYGEPAQRYAPHQKTRQGTYCEVTQNSPPFVCPISLAPSTKAPRMPQVLRV
jgi:hypothetical protein